MAPRTHLRATLHAAQLLGAQIRVGRIERGWTMVDLAERVGVTERTVRKIEGGDVRVALGTVFDCAALVGVPLFYEDEQRVASEAVRERAVVMGRRVRPAEPEVDLDF